MFISFEGIDGCGKTTQIEQLSNYFEKRGAELIKLREPGGTATSEQIRSILLNHKNDIDSVTELFLFEAARSCLVQQIIKPALDEGKIVLSDRFFDSTIAYQGYGRGLNMEMINKLNEFATQNIKPDITFYLKISLDLSNQRTKYKNPDRMELSGQIFFERVIKGFDEIALKEPNRVITIDSSGQVQKTFSLIEKAINERF
ncbi:MAG: dTMP kinase [Candidatus Kapabacteria bacterium]|nr:dTMP kinase [Candidatus Kapabacteria bacterium]